MEKTLWFTLYSDYRAGMNVYVYNRSSEDSENSEEENAPEDALDITFKLPKKNYRIFLINEYPSYNNEPIWYKDLPSKDECEKVYKKLFSQIHDCMPFKVTGYNSSYKEEGFYPKISEDIKLMSEIDIGTDIYGDGIYFLCVLDNEGNEIFTKLLSPLF
uniref:Uncharacterized protein n=1 Tax=viral metagenome TaxID=1070528 RepID=A0A6C0E1E2_9ZZZZ